MDLSDDNWKFTKDQFQALAYIFEQDNGNEKSEYELEIIANSGLSKLVPKELEKSVTEALNNGIYNGTEERISAYWALGKRFNTDLIPFFRTWLKQEIELNDAQAVYQILIALDNLEEPVFNPDRNGSYASFESELNMRDAIEYLNK